MDRICCIRAPSVARALRGDLSSNRVWSRPGLEANGDRDTGPGERAGSVTAVPPTTEKNKNLKVDSAGVDLTTHPLNEWMIHQLSYYTVVLFVLVRDDSDSI